MFVKHGVNAKWLVSIRLLTAGIILLIPTIIGEKKKVIDIWKRKENILPLMIFSVFGMGLCQLSYYSAVELSNAGIATVIQYTAPSMIFIYFTLKNRKMPSKIETIALVFAMLGVFLLATRGNLTSLNISKEAFAWGITSAVMMAVFNVVPIELMKKYGTACVTGWGMLIAGIIMSAYVKPWNIVGNWNGKAIGALVIVVIVGTVLSFFFYMFGVKSAGAKTASLLASVEPLTATVMTTLIMGISFVKIEIVGMIIIILAVIMLTIRGEE